MGTDITFWVDILAQEVPNFWYIAHVENRACFIVHTKNSQENFELPYSLTRDPQKCLEFIRNKTNKSKNFETVKDYLEIE